MQQSHFFERSYRRETDIDDNDDFDDYYDNEDDNLICEEDCSKAIFLNGVIREKLKPETVSFAGYHLFRHCHDGDHVGDDGDNDGDDGDNDDDDGDSDDDDGDSDDDNVDKN